MPLRLRAPPKPKPLTPHISQSFKLELTDAPDDATGAIDTRKLAELSGAVCAAAPAEAYVLAASVKAGGRTCAGAIAAILSWHSTGQEALNLALGPAAASASCSEISAYDLFCLEVPWQATTAGGVVGVALAADVAVSAILAYVFAAVRNLDLDEPTAGALCVVGFGECRVVGVQPPQPTHTPPSLPPGAAKRGFGADRWGRPLAALAPQYTPMLLRESAKVIAGEYDSALVAALVTSSSFTIDSEVPGTVTAFDLMSAQCEGHNHLRDLPGHGGTFFKLLRDLHEAIVERPRDPEMFPADAELFGITARAQTIVAEAILGKAAPDDAWGAAAALAVRCAPDVARVRSVGVAAAAAAALHTNKRALATEALLIILRGLPREDANLVEGILPKAFDPKRVGLHLKERKDAALVAASLVGLADIAVAATKAAGTGDPVYRLLGASDEMGNASKRLVDKSALLFAACGLRAARTVLLDAKSHSQDFVAALRARMADAVEKLLPTANLLASSVRALDALPASEHGDALTEAAAIATLCEQIFASTAAASKKSGPRKTQLFGTVSSGAPSKSRELGGALVLYECCKCLQLLPYMPSGSFSVAANLLTHTLLPVSAAAQRAVVEAIAAAGSAAGEDAIAAQVGHAVAQLPLGSSERLTGAVFAKTIIAGSASLAAAEAVALPMLVCADRRHRLAAVLLMEAIASKTPPRTSNVSSAVFAQEVLIGQKAVSCMAAGTGAVRAPRLGVMCNIDEVWAHCVCSIAEIAGNPTYRDVTELVWAQLRSDTGVWTAAGGIANTLALAFGTLAPPRHRPRERTSGYRRVPTPPSNLPLPPPQPSPRRPKLRFRASTTRSPSPWSSCCRRAAAARNCSKLSAPGAPTPPSTARRPSWRRAWAGCGPPRSGAPTATPSPARFTSSSRACRRATRSVPCSRATPTWRASARRSRSRTFRASGTTRTRSCLAACFWRRSLRRSWRAPATWSARRPPTSKSAGRCPTAGPPSCGCASSATRAGSTLRRCLVALLASTFARRRPEPPACARRWPRRWRRCCRSGACSRPTSSTASWTAPWTAGPSWTGSCAAKRSMSAS